MSLVTSRIFFQANALRFLTPQSNHRTFCAVSSFVLRDNGIFDKQRSRALVERIEFPISSFARSIQYSSLKFASQTEDGKDKANQENSTSFPSGVPTSNSADPPKLSIIQKFKQMYKQYWYVLIPVHCFTSVFWAGGFYFAVKNGLDVVALLESLSISERIIDPLRNSSVGYYALAYALYKVASPARYAVTIGGTTVTINYLTKWGYIKPVPTKDQLQVMYDVKKASFNKKRDELRKKLRLHKAELMRKKIRFSSKRAKKT